MKSIVMGKQICIKLLNRSVLKTIKMKFIKMNLTHLGFEMLCYDFQLLLLQSLRL